MVARTVEVDLPAQTTLDQAIVALLKHRRGDVPGDATLEQSAVLRFQYTTCEAATPAVPPEEITPEEQATAGARTGQAANHHKHPHGPEAAAAGATTIDASTGTWTVSRR